MNKTRVLATKTILSFFRCHYFDVCKEYYLIRYFMSFSASLKNAIILTLNDGISVNIGWQCSHNTSKFKLNTAFNKHYLNNTDSFFSFLNRMNQRGRTFLRHPVVMVSCIKQILNKKYANEFFTPNDSWKRVFGSSEY